jgi:hypothetical protein
MPEFVDLFAFIPTGLRHIDSLEIVEARRSPPLKVNIVAQESWTSDR